MEKFQPFDWLLRLSLLITFLHSLSLSHTVHSKAGEYSCLFQAAVATWISSLLDLTLMGVWDHLDLRPHWCWSTHRHLLYTIPTPACSFTLAPLQPTPTHFTPASLQTTLVHQPLSSLLLHTSSIPTILHQSHSCTSAPLQPIVHQPHSSLLLYSSPTPANFTPASLQPTLVHQPHSTPFYTSFLQPTHVHQPRSTNLLYTSPTSIYCGCWSLRALMPQTVLADVHWIQFGVEAKVLAQFGVWSEILLICRVHFFLIPLSRFSPDQEMQQSS